MNFFSIFNHRYEKFCLWVFNGIVYLIDELNNLYQTNQKSDLNNTVIIGEYGNKKFEAFDCIIFKGENLSNKIFKERYNYLDRINLKKF